MINQPLFIRYIYLHIISFVYHNLRPYIYVYIYIYILTNSWVDIVMAQLHFFTKSEKHLQQPLILVFKIAISPRAKNTFKLTCFRSVRIPQFMDDSDPNYPTW